MKKTLKWLINIVFTIFIIICIVSTVLLLHTNDDGIITFKNNSLVIVDDGNKDLNIKNNDFLVLENIKFKDLEVNDIVVYTRNTNNKLPDIEFGKILGFGNSSLNNISLIVNDYKGLSIEVSEESYVGKWNDKKILFFGVIFNVLLSKPGFLIGIILPLFLILIYEVFRMVIAYKMDDVENNEIDKYDNIVDSNNNKDVLNIKKDEKDREDNNIEVL